jgi:hypothetical protein
MDTKEETATQENTAQAGTDAAKREELKKLKEAKKAAAKAEKEQKKLEREQKEAERKALANQSSFKSVDYVTTETYGDVKMIRS